MTITLDPAPLNGSAPNLLVVDTDREGQQYYKRAFNTQVWYLRHTCEKLNAWLGGFESILKRMTPSNFRTGSYISSHKTAD
jgi:hypothetical protein